MSIERKYRFHKKLSVLMAVIFLYQLLFPSAVFALTGGPSQPEFSSFEPVATTNMVNDFSGDFTYNLPVLEVPGANGGGYPLSLSYHSGASPEEEASWVGYGWTLNPGAINRSKRGFPDDYKGEDVKYWNTVPSNKTVRVSSPTSPEVFSIGSNTLAVSATLRYNNYKGFGLTAGAGLSLGHGVVSLGFSVTDGKGSFSARVNPAAILNRVKYELAKKDGNDPATEQSDGNDPSKEKQKDSSEGDKKKNEKL